MGTTGGGGLFPENPNGHRDQPTIAFGFIVESVGGVGGVGGGGGGGAFVVPPPFVSTIVPIWSVLFPKSPLPSALR